MSDTIDSIGAILEARGLMNNDPRAPHALNEDPAQYKRHTNSSIRDGKLVESPGGLVGPNVKLGANVYVDPEAIVTGGKEPGATVIGNNVRLMGQTTVVNSQIPGESYISNSEVGNSMFKSAVAVVRSKVGHTTIKESPEKSNRVVAMLTKLEYFAERLIGSKQEDKIAGFMPTSIVDSTVQSTSVEHGARIQNQNLKNAEAIVDGGVTTFVQREMPHVPDNIMGQRYAHERATNEYKKMMDARPPVSPEVLARYSNQSNSQGQGRV